MNEQLSKKLKECGVKKSLIEAQLKMPKNSLAGMMNGTRPTPEKWHDKLQQFIDTLEGKIKPWPVGENLFEQMQDAVKNEPGFFIPKLGSDLYFDGVFKKAAEENGLTDGKPVTVTVQLPPKTDDFLKELETGVNHVLEYCQSVGISIQELVSGYMKWREIEMKDKPKLTAEDGKKEAYDPTKDWRFKKKMGID